MTVTRRRLLTVTAVAAGAAALPRVAAQAAPGAGLPVVHTQVVVVGAGIAGLVTARRLRAEGVEVIVLEARDRVGGRTLNVVGASGAVGDLGGTWVGPTQNRVVALAAELGLEIFDQVDDGDALYYGQGRLSTYSDSGPTGGAPNDPTLLADLALVVTLIDRMSTEVPVDAPWDAPKAQEWDDQTLATWLAANTVNPQIREVASAAFNALVGAETRECSLLYALWYVACAGDENTPGTFERLINIREGAQARRFVTGAQSLSLRMAAQLGDAVRLSSPVRFIGQRETGVTVVSDTVVVEAERVVVAAPPALAARIDYSPLLPQARDFYAQHSPQGHLAKVEVVYPTPFWRAAGLSGAVVSDTGPGKIVYDATPKDGRVGTLLVFVGGDAARQYAGRPQEMRDAVVANLVTYFGAEAASPAETTVQEWGGQQWSRGGPVHVLGAGVLTQYREAIVAPVGRIHWAGTETAGYWHGYMDGAVRSGERAAVEVRTAGLRGVSPGPAGGTRPAGSVPAAAPATDPVLATTGGSALGATAAVATVVVAAGLRQSLRAAPAEVAVPGPVTS